VGAALFGGGVPVMSASAPLPPAAAAADDDTPREPADASSLPRVSTGLDVLVQQDFAMFAGQSIGLVTNHTGVDASGRRAIDLIAEAPGVRLQAIFAPEHGVTGAANTDVPHGRDAVTGRPIWSLYGPTRRPTADMLRGVTLLVF